MANPNDGAQTEFALKLIEVGEKKISVIKAIMQIAGLDTAQAKELMERAPVVVLAGVPQAEAMRGRYVLEKAGAWVAIE